jgi:hypothetical protein
MASNATYLSLQPVLVIKKPLLPFLCNPNSLAKHSVLYPQFLRGLVQSVVWDYFCQQEDQRPITHRIILTCVVDEGVHIFLANILDLGAYGVSLHRYGKAVILTGEIIKLLQRN